MCLYPRMACSSRPCYGEADKCLHNLYLHPKYWTQKPSSKNILKLFQIHRLVIQICFSPQPTNHLNLYLVDWCLCYVFGNDLLQPHQLMARLVLEAELKSLSAKFCSWSRALNNFSMPTIINCLRQLDLRNLKLIAASNTFNGLGLPAHCGHNSRLSLSSLE